MTEPILTQFLGEDDVSPIADQISQKLGSFGEKFAGTTEIVKGAFGAMGLAASGFLFQSLHTFDESANAARTFARTIGSSVEDASGLIEVADDMQVSYSELSSAMTIFQRKLAGVGDVEELFAQSTAKAQEKVDNLQNQLDAAQDKLLGYYQKIKDGKATQEEMADSIENQKGKIDQLEDRLANAKEALVDGGVAMKGFKGALQELGISFNDTNGNSRPFLDILRDISDKFKAMPDGPDKARIAMALFGTQGKNLLPLLNLGSEEMARMTEEAKKLGIVMTEKDVSASRELFVATDKLQDTMKGFQLNVIRPLVPDIIGFQTKVSDMATGMTNAANPFTAMIGKGLSLAAVFGSLIGGSSFIYQLVTGFDSLKNLMASLTAFTGPLGVFLAIVVALGLAWSTNFLGLRDKAMPVLNRLMEILGNIKDFLFDLVNSASPEEFGKKLQKGLAAIIDPEMAARISAFATDVVKFVLKIGDAIGKLASGDTEGAKKALMGAFDVFLGSGKTEEIINTITTTIQTLYSTIESGATTAISTATQKFDELKVAGAAIWESIRPGLEMFITLFVGQALPAVEFFASELASFFGPKILEARDAIIAFGSELGERFGPAIANILTVLAAVVLGIITFINTHKEDILKVWEDIWTVAEGVFRVAWALISGIIKVALDLLAGNFDLAGKDIIEMVIGMKDGIVEVMRGIVLFVFDLISYMVKIFDEVKPHILKAAGDLIKVVVKAITEKAKEVVSPLLDKLDDVVSGIQEKAAAFKSNAEKLIVQFIVGIAGKVANVVVQFTDLWTAINTEISSWPQKLFDWGASLISSFIDGILSMWQDFLSALQKFADAIPHSPARVGPFSQMPNWRSYFGELPSAVDDAVNAANTSLSRFYTGMPDKLTVAGVGGGGGMLSPGLPTSGKSVHVDTINIVASDLSNPSMTREQVRQMFDDLLT